MRWRPGPAAPDPAEETYNALPNLLAGFEGPFHDREGKRKRNMKELEKGKRKRGEKVKGG